ncbi:MAG: hypothetical protein R3236_04440 [Phycisphaeraceae bacterium]|nr:hypothetical protein [Phycisphaeraceae bacterium]
MTETTIDQVMEQASEALARTHYAACEKLCLEAMDRALKQQDYDHVARIALPLQEARRQRRQAADDRGVHMLTGPRKAIAQILNDHPTGGLLLTAPPYTPQDARDLAAEARDRGLNVEVVLLDAPAQAAAFEWLLQQRGDRILAECVDPDPRRHLEAICRNLEAIGDHEIAHQQLADLARRLSRADNSDKDEATSA